MPLFLAFRARGHDIQRACELAKVDEAVVEIAKAKHPKFGVACGIIDRELRRRAFSDAKAKAEMVTGAELQDVVESLRASLCLHQADITAIVHLCDRIAAAAGVDHLEGMSIVEWFNRHRQTQLERELMAIGDTDPDAVARLECHFESVRHLAGANSILQPPED